MKLLRFRVREFRSVTDSGWIEIEDVTALIGTNEAGKTNLLLPLWKLKPASVGGIDPISDYPRKRYNQIRNLQTKPRFIEAMFELPDKLAQEIALLTKVAFEFIQIVSVSRDFDGNYFIDFPEIVLAKTTSKTAILQRTKDCLQTLQSESPYGKEEAIYEDMLEQVGSLEATLEAHSDEIGIDFLQTMSEQLASVDLSKAAKSSVIRPRYERLIDFLTEITQSISIPHPAKNDEVKNIIVDSLPSFVYYSNYGNLDSEIYLPHVIENLQRTDLGSKEQAKVRTLKVLFDFVKLKPQEILDLGKEVDTRQRKPTATEIEETAKKKKEREILLQSASTELTLEFRNWWRQGNYRIRFQADGNHFRIWVSDDKRPEEIELEGRSAGLQWFLSFFLVFLVESEDSHRETIILLDEPGHSLHPLAQQDLSLFFENLAKTNQLIYTTHSLHMIDPNHLNRVRSVFVDADGTTKASSDLRASVNNSAHQHSVYPVQGALGLSTSEAYLFGCQPVIVEGASDQYYLTAIKSYLIRENLISPAREIVFIPAGGAKGVKTTAPILSARDGELPPVIIDSDRQGTMMAKSLKQGLYNGNEELIIEIGSFVNFDNAEIEDLVDHALMEQTISREFRGREHDFDEVVRTDESIIPQIEAYVTDQNLVLEKGWKVEIAKQVKKKILKTSSTIQQDTVEEWVKLFSVIG